MIVSFSLKVNFISEQGGIGFENLSNELKSYLDPSLRTKLLFNRLATLVRAPLAVVRAFLAALTGSKSFKLSIVHLRELYLSNPV